MEFANKPREISLQITFEESDIQRIEKITSKKIKTKEDLYDSVWTALNTLDINNTERNATIIKKFFKSDKWSYNDFEEFTNMPISAEILDSGIMYYIENTIEQIPDDTLKTFSNKYEEKLK